MLEPPFNPALHRQAINRVYRLGQKKKVFIHTMVMRDSIESRLWDINKDKINDIADVAGNVSAKQSHRRMVGNINGDRSANMAHSEIERLFQDVSEE